MRKPNRRLIRQRIQDNRCCIFVRGIYIRLLKTELSDPERNILATPILRLGKKAAAHQEITPAEVFMFPNLSTQMRKLVDNRSDYYTLESLLKSTILEKPIL